MIKGTVIHGKKLGREIGFPTANLDVDSQDTNLEDGIYAAVVTYQDKKYNGALVIQHDAPVEIHMLDFSGELYDEALIVEPKEKVSEYYSISDMEELKIKIGNDITKIRKYFR